MQLRSSPNPPPRVRLVAHVDATAPDIACCESASVEAFEKSHRPDVQVAVQLRHQATGRGHTISLPLTPDQKRSHQGKAVAGLAGGTALITGATVMASRLGAQDLSPWLRGLGLVGVLGGMAAGLYGLGQLVSLMGENSIEEPAQGGTRVYEIGPDRSNQLDTAPREVASATAASAAELSRFVQQSFSRSSGEVNVMLVAGHGHGYHKCAGFSLEEIQAAAATQKPDLLVLESCLMGNLEGLLRLQGAAHLVLASENIQTAGLSHWGRLFDSLPEGQLSAESLGRHILSQADQRGDFTTTLALIDLDKLSPVGQGMEALALRLRSQAASGQGPAIRQALSQARKIDRSASDFRDLGSVLNELDQALPDQTTRKAIERVRQCMHEAIVADWSCQPLSHLSIQGPGLSRDYEEQTDMPEWAALLRSLAN